MAGYPVLAKREGNNPIEDKVDNEAVAKWLSCNEESVKSSKAVGSARKKAAGKIAAAIVAEVAFNDSVAQAETAHSTSKQLDEAIQAQIEAGEDADSEFLLDRAEASKAARSAAFDVVTKSEVATECYAAAADAARIRASADVAYLRALSDSEMALDDVVTEYLR